jgi:hypothetical protein
MSEVDFVMLTEKSVYFSLCLDDSTDQTDVSQLLIFVRAIQSDTSTHEEVLNLVSLQGTTKRSDISEAVRNCVDKYGGFNKCSSIVTDGAKAMVGEQKGFFWTSEKIWHQMSYFSPHHSPRGFMQKVNSRK